ncbi:MAG: hypothetical protein H0W50_06960 [Parachlamydiaceae bacterium]|nr:hypothetical protein [Parachlamydiaceae bacterium]
MDFTREPIIESVITPKEGCTLVVRSSKSSGQEEHFVDAVEVVTFGSALFFRSRERPKAFLVPVTDYEILEVRETRLLLKNVGIDRAIKIAGGREAPLNAGRDISTSKAEPRHAPLPEKQAVHQNVPHLQPQAVALPEEATPTDSKTDLRLDKKRDRRRNHRRRRGKDDEGEKTCEEDVEGVDGVDKFSPESGRIELPAPHLIKDEPGNSSSGVPASAMLSSLLSPPPNLISETIARYKDNVLFKGAFFSKEDDSVEFNDDSEDEGKEDEENEGNEGSEKIASERDGHESGYKSESDDHLHRQVLHEGISDHDDEIHIPEMSLDYPVYGSLNGPLAGHNTSADFVEMSHDKSPEVIHHVPHAAGYVSVDDVIDELPLKEEVVSAVEESPMIFKAIPEEHLMLPVEEPFFVVAGDDDFSLPFDNFEDEFPLSNHLESTSNDHVSDEDINGKSNGAS